MTRLLAWPLRTPRLTVALVVVVTIGFAAFVPRLGIDSSIETLLPAHDPDRTYYEAARATFGSDEVTVVGVFGDDVFAPATLARIDALGARLAAIEGVREIISLTTVEGVTADADGVRFGRLLKELPHGHDATETFRARVLATPLYVGNIVSADSRSAGLTVVFDSMTGEELRRRGLADAVARVVAEYDGPERVAITGLPTLKAAGAHSMERDIATFTPLGVLLATFVLLFAFRTVRGVLVPLVGVSIGLTWTIGLMARTGYAITMGTLVLPPLLITIGLAYVIHVVAQYYAELRPDRDPRAVVEATLRDVAVPVAICGGTTLVAFTPFLLSPIPAIVEFGMFATFGVAAICAIALTFVPAVLVLLPLPPPSARIPIAGTGRGLADRIPQIVGAASVAHARLTLCTALLVGVAAAWGATRLVIETDYVSFFAPASPVRVDHGLISSRLAGAQPIYVVFDGPGPGTMTRLDTLQAMSEVQAFIDRQPGVDGTISMLDYLALGRHALGAEAGRRPTSQAETDQLMMLVDPEAMRALLSRDQARANIVVRTQLSGSAEVGAFVRRVETFTTSHLPADVRVRATGTVVLLNRSADVLAHGLLHGLWQVLLVLLMMMSLLFLSVRVGLISLLPNVLPILVLLGVMGWEGIPLNVSTSMIAVIAIGIAIDDTIHLFSAFNTELRRLGDQRAAVASAVGRVGRAITFTSLSLMAGFAVVCLSSFQPVQYFGLLSMLTVAVALVADLTMTPALLSRTRIITMWDLLRVRLGPAPHREIPLFAELRSFQAKIVVLMATMASAEPGARIARRGDVNAELYVLLSGRAEVQGRHGAVIRVLGRGDVVGEMGLVRNRPRSANVVVTERAEYLRLGQPFLRRLRRRYPRIASTVLLNLGRILSDRLEDTTDRLAGEAGEAPTTASLEPRKENVVMLSTIRRPTALAGAILLAGAAALVAATASAAESPRALMRHVLESVPSVPFTAHMTLTTEGGMVRELAAWHKSIAGGRAVYLEVMAPFNLKDTRFLFRERIDRPDEQFIYLPAFARATKVGENTRQQPFLGSDYYVSDLVMPALDAFTYADGGATEISGRACRLIEATPKNPEGELYSKSIFAIDPTDRLVVRAEFFDAKGAPFKVWAADKIEQIDGIWTATEQHMTNVQEGVTSRLAIVEVRYNDDVPNETFGPAHLAR